MHMCVVILKEFGPPWKKQYFRNDKYMGFIKGGWLNVISEWLLLLYLRLALKSSGKKYQEGMMDVKWWRQEQRGTPKHDLEVVLASPCIQSSFCNEVVIFWEWKKKQHARLLPHNVRQQISNRLCGLPQCLRSCTALLSTKNMAASFPPSKSV